MASLLQRSWSWSGAGKAEPAGPPRPVLVLLIIFCRRFIVANFYHVLPIFWHLLRCQNLILQCSKYTPHAYRSPSAGGRSANVSDSPAAAIFRRHKGAPQPAGSRAVAAEAGAQANQPRAARRR